MALSILKKFLLPAGVLSGSRALTGPMDVSADVTGRCNLNCIGCTDHSPLLKDSNPADETPSLDMPLSTFSRLCDGLSAFPDSTLLLTGEGEPLLHPQVIEMVRYAKDRRLKVRLSTNGTLLNTEKSAQLIATGLDELIFSFWAIDPDHADRLYPDRGPETLAVQLENMQRLREGKNSSRSAIPRLVLYHPFNRFSISHPDRILDVAARNGCDFVHFSLLRTRQGRISTLAPDPDQVRTLDLFSRSAAKFPVPHNLRDVILAYRLGEKVWEKTPCYVGWFGFYLNRAGEIQPCKMCRLVLGDLVQTPLKEWWNGETMRRFRKRAATPTGMRALLSDSDCEYCCYAVANYRMKRRTGWIKKGGTP